MANVGASSRQNQSNIDDTQRNVVVKPVPVSALPGQGYSYKNPITGGGVEVSPTGKTTYITPKKSSGGGGGGGSSSSVVSNTSSPTGYSDTLGQPVSVAPSVKANTLVNQSFNKSGSSIGPLQDYGFVKPYQQSFGGALVQTGKNIFYDIGIAFGSASNRDKEYRSITEPMNRYGTYNYKSFFSTAPLGIGIPGGIGIPSFGKRNSFETRETSFAKSYSQQLPIIKQQEDLTSGFTTKANDYSSGLSSQAQGEYNSAFDIAQGGVSSGTWSLSQGQDYLKQVGSSIETKYKTQLETYNKNLQTEYSTSMGALEGKREKVRESVYGGQIGLGTIGKGVFEIGAISLGGPQVAIAFGVKDVISGGMNQNVFQTVGGLSMVGISTGTQLAKLPYEISQSSALSSLEKQSFKFAEARFEGINSDFSIVRGTRTAGGLIQDINVAGKVIKKNELFFQPGSQLTSNIGGTIESNWYGNLFKVKPQAYIGSQIGEFGSKGFTLPVTGITSGEEIFGTIGKGTFVIKEESFGITKINKLKDGSYGYDSDKLISSFKANTRTFENKYKLDYFSGFSKKLNDNTFVSRSGKITKMELNPGEEFGGFKISKEGLFIEANLKDITFTKTFPKSSLGTNTIVDFSNTKSGLQGLTQISKSSFSGSGLVTKSIIQESKGSFIPKMITQTQSLSSKGFGVSANSLSSFKTTPTQMSMSGLITIQRNKDYSLGTSFSKLDARVITNSIPRVSSASAFGFGTSFKQPSSQLSGLSSMQLTKTDLGLKQMSMQELAMPSITPTGFGGFGGIGGFDFGFPGIGLPSFGGGLGYAKPKTRSKKRKTKIRPSLTAELFDIRGSLPKGGTFGITPFQIRAIPKGKGNPYATKF
jgi:hypothetical protein